MTQLRPELRVEIRKFGNRYQAITRASDDQEITTHEFQYDTASLVRGAMAWIPGLTDDEQSAADGYDPVQIAAQGEQLYRDLFDNGRRLRDYLASHRDAQQGQLTLSFDQNASLLARLPWEYLYNGDAYLSLSGNLPVSHRPYDLHSLSLPATPLPLRILLVMPAPEDQMPFEPEQGISLFHEALDDAIRTGAIELDVLSEPTSTILLETIQARAFHVVHYIGHGVFQLPQHEGFLCLEDSVGCTELVGGEQLFQLLKAHIPHLVVLSGCPCVQYGVADAFAHIAHSLLQHDVPAVLSVPVSLDDEAALVFYQTLYSSLTAAESVAESLHRGRLALAELDNEIREARQRFDWAVPLLYQRNAHICLVEQGEPATPTQVEMRKAPGLHVIGRTAEMNMLQQAIKESAQVFYVWGSDGVGKRSFVSYLIDHITTQPVGTLKIRCSEETNPLIALGQISDFWRAEGGETGIQAARLLLDARQEPRKRAQKAQKLARGMRLLYQFENVDRWFATGSQNEDQDARAAIREIILGLISVPSKSRFFFTGSQHWNELLQEECPGLREIYLPLLSVDWAIQIMNRMPELRTATLAQKRAVHWHLGGHPKSLELLAGWLSFGQDLADLLAAPPVGERSTGLWEAFLIDELLDLVDPGEYQVLQALAPLGRPFSAAVITELTPVTSQYACPLIKKWCRLGLIERVNAGADELRTRFDFYAPVRDAILVKLSAAELTERHLQAAAYYGAPFIDAARRQVLARNINAWTENRIEWLARDANGILGTMLRQQKDPGAQREILERAMAWQHHLFAAGKIDEATQVIQATAPKLKREGQVDLAEALLQRTVKLPAQASHITGADQLALCVEGEPLSAALDVYQQVYAALDAKDSDLQRAHVLMRAAWVQYRLGKLEDAIKSFTQALQSTRREGDKEGEAECLRRLAMLHRETGNLREALVYSQAAKEHYEAFDSPSGLASAEREQGLILKELGHLENALESFATSLRICRRLGDTQGITENLTEVGLIFEKLGRNEMAIQVIEEALQHYEHLKSPEHNKILSLLEDLYARKQRLDEAVAKLRTARGATHGGPPAP